ncbi:MAG: UDP-N-acetylmuramoyl-L-alanyl-D-glutamate--2,6-diaminopimelate ligase [Gammaproteobacteria bacterium]
MMAVPLQPRSVPLSRLLHGIAPVADRDDRPVTGLQLDSRKIEAGDLFVACRGSRVHGISHLAEALQRGAVAVVYDPEGASGVHPLGVPAVAVENLGDRLGGIAARFYGDPSRDLRVVGITGTNGKTSSSHYLAQALHGADTPCGLIGTLGSGLFDALESQPNTTPDAIAVQAALAGFRTAGAAWAVMEVSSHALTQGRVNGVAFDCAVFTNLSHDHLDYHGDMRAYEAAKRRLFEWAGLGSAVVNADDPVGRRLLADIDPDLQRIAYGLNPEAVQAAARDGIDPLWAEAVSLDAEGLELRVQGAWGDGALRAPLLGRFNASNLMAVLAVLLREGWSLERALERLSATRPVPGRMERFGGGAGPQAVVDYAHTPDALEQALSALHEHCRGELWCVFGCGGDRDRAKRPEMGRIAERWADRVIVTDDNPRGESGDQIIAEILQGMRDPARVIVERHRDTAIRRAFSEAAADDLILVAGKGHEAYQEVAGKRLEQSDRALVRILTEAGE